MKFRTGTLYTQKMAHLYGRATNSSCLLCHQPDSQIHMLFGCQNASNQNMVTERHNIASRLIIKTLNKGDFGGNIIFTDIGSETRMAQHSLVFPAHVANRTLPQWLLPNLAADELRSCSRPDAICIVRNNYFFLRENTDTSCQRKNMHIILHISLSKLITVTDWSPCLSRQRGDFAARVCARKQDQLTLLITCSRRSNKDVAT